MGSHAHSRVIRQGERGTYEAMWDVPTYAEMSPGEKYAPIFRELTKGQHGDTVIDAGCGSGKGALALKAAGYDVHLCDLTDAGLVDAAKALKFTPVCLWDDLKPQLGYQFGSKVDWVYCCDVMEHLPTAFTMLVAQRLIDAARFGVFFSITLQPDAFGVWVGKPLHQTVQPFTWWRDALKELGTVKECRDLLTTGLYMVAP